MADNSTILEKLDGLVARFEEISTLITDPSVIADQKRYVKLTKEYKELDDLMKARKEYIQLLGNIEEAKNILANESDAEMREMAKEEMDNSQERLPVLEEEIKLMLVPADPQDSKNAILEIRGGAGGEESALFSAVLFRMYSMYAEKKGFKIEIINANETEIGGYKEISFMITGQGAYSRLKYESGVHRVQRIPATESGGRIHTSTVTVAVLPEAEVRAEFTHRQQPLRFCPRQKMLSLKLIRMTSKLTPSVQAVQAVSISTKQVPQSESLTCPQVW